MEPPVRIGPKMRQPPALQISIEDIPKTRQSSHNHRHLPAASPCFHPQGKDDGSVQIVYHKHAVQHQRGTISTMLSPAKRNAACHGRNALHDHPPHPCVDHWPPADARMAAIRCSHKVQLYESDSSQNVSQEQEELVKAELTDFPMSHPVDNGKGCLKSL